MAKDGLLHALLIDGQGGAESIIENPYDRLEKASNDLIWFHFDYTTNDSVKWLMNQQFLDDVSKNFLLTEDTRPRVLTINNALLLAMRGVNSNPHSDPEDMIGLRVWANDSIIITTIKRKLFSIEDIVHSLQKGCGPKTSSEFLVALVNQITKRIGPVIETVEEELDSFEEQFLDVRDHSKRRQLSTTRREIVSLRKFLAPQREAMQRLFEENIFWLKESDSLHIREANNHLYRYIENLDSIKDRALILQEELTNSLSEQINSRMYVLSLVTAIFLPLSFLTGLFGINVGGIPGADNKFAFLAFVVILTAIVAIVVSLFKIKRWI